MVISSADFVLGPGEKICSRREREAGTRVHTTGAVSFVQITVFGNWTPLKAALGAEASPLPWWLCRVFLILSQSQETKPTKQKDSNSRFVQVHTCHVFIGMPFDSLKKEKVEGWVVMGWLPSWVAGEKLEKPIKMHASEYCLHLWNFKDIFEVSWVWNMILRWFKFCEPQQNWPINW